MSTHNEERLVPQRDQPRENTANQFDDRGSISKYKDAQKHEHSTIEKEIGLGEMPVINNNSSEERTEFSDRELQDMIHVLSLVEDHSNTSESNGSLASTDSGEDSSPSDSSDFAIPLVTNSTEENKISEKFSANNELVVGNEYSEYSLFALNPQDNNGGQNVPNIYPNEEEQSSLFSQFGLCCEYDNIPKEIATCAEKSDSMESDVDIHHMESLSIQEQTQNGEKLLEMVRTTSTLQPATDEYEGYKFPLRENGGFSCDSSLPLTSQGQMVTGYQDSTPTLKHWDLSAMIPADIMVEPHHLLEKGIRLIGTALNPLVTEVHKNPNNSVKFCTRKKIRTIKKKNRRATLTEDVPVDSPMQCQEAFEGRCILRHMRQGKNFYEYADVLHYHKPRELKSDIDQILGRIPGRRTPSLTWGSLFATLHCMESLLEKAHTGLQHANRFLALKINEGINGLGDIIEKASHVQQLSLRSTK